MKLIECQQNILERQPFWKYCDIETYILYRHQNKRRVQNFSSIGCQKVVLIQLARFDLSKLTHIASIIKAYISLTLSYSTFQALSFDTHIKGVDKKYIIRHLGAAAILKLLRHWNMHIVLSPELRVCAKF